MSTAEAKALVQARRQLADARAENERLRGEMQHIATVDPGEWHQDQGWECVEFIQRIARAAAVPEERS